MIEQTEGRHFSIVFKKGSAKAEAFSQRLFELINSYPNCKADIGMVMPQSEAVVVVGGDGTLLHVAQEAYRYQIPIIGINMGALGFLTEVGVNDAFFAIEKLVAQKLKKEERIMLSVRLDAKTMRENVGKLCSSQEFDFLALNEVVIARGNTGRMITLHVSCNGAFLSSYRGDGLIISTPTGSTAYNLSAGGPVVHPGTSAVILTPICPFALGARPIILPSDVELSITLDELHSDILLVIDGQATHVLAHEISRNISQSASQNVSMPSSLRIQKAPNTLKLITSPVKDYLTILREKLGWGKVVGG